jgi:hypothetical protein
MYLYLEPASSIHLGQDCVCVNKIYRQSWDIDVVAYFTLFICNLLDEHFVHEFHFQKWYYLIMRIRTSEIRWAACGIIY